MIGTNAVATAGHIVYKRGEPDGDFFVGNATIVPAHNSNANSHPYGAAYATHFYCGGGWAYNGDRSDDWGIIELDTNIGNKTGWLGLRWQSTPYKDKAVFVNGYPTVVNGKENLSPATGDRDQYYRYGTVTASLQTNMLESIDMFASGGDSGGPCYIYSSETGYTAIGITSRGLVNSSGDTSWVRFRTIDKNLFERFREFRTSTL